MKDLSYLVEALENAGKESSKPSYEDTISEVERILTHSVKMVTEENFSDKSLIMGRGLIMPNKEACYVIQWDEEPVLTVVEPKEGPLAVILNDVDDTVTLTAEDSLQVNRVINSLLSRSNRTVSANGQEMPKEMADALLKALQKEEQIPTREEFVAHGMTQLVEQLKQKKSLPEALDALIEALAKERGFSPEIVAAIKADRLEKLGF